MDRIETTALADKGKTALLLLYACTIFLSAFLLFQVQPLVGKMLLPWFGGSAAVWSTCLLFFQVLLLLGYLYAHWTRRLAARTQATLHIVLLAGSIALLPIMPDVSWKPTGAEDPTLRILALLMTTIGLPYFLLSTTGPLLQAWFARERPGTVPYRLFALSNFGSMLGLLSYPLLFEPSLTTATMSVIWSVAYATFTILCGLLAARGASAAAPVHKPTLTETPPTASGRALWALLAACATVLLMGVTSHLTQNVAPVPLLWVLPLALYLLSFILCFEGGNWYRREWYLPLFILWFALMTIDLISPLIIDGAALPVMFYCSGLFIACMLCHGELAAQKPHPEHLTSFYLMVAAGGALGGCFVALIAPRVFNSNVELPAAAIVTALVATTLAYRSYRLGAWRGAMALAVALIAIVGFLGIARQGNLHRVLVRNFYGTLAVDDRSNNGHPIRELAHGVILHGAQFMDSERRRWPTTYYGDNSGAGLAVLATRRVGEAQRVGVIGLGVGTMAAWGRAGDDYRFYEINPLVLQLARSEFSFLADSPARVHTVLGDARLTLEREAPQGFNVLVVDAFSGDSIPVHLLTLEAFALYFQHLRPGGILAVHVSNRSLDLVPVVQNAAAHYRKQARAVDTERDLARGLLGSEWILISDEAAVLDRGVLEGMGEEIEPEFDVRPWTDDYSSIYPILE